MSAPRVTGSIIAKNVIGADPFVTEGDGSRSETPLTATFTFTPFATCTFAAVALCHVTVGTLILFLTQESVKGFGVVGVRSDGLVFNGELAA